MLDAIGIRSSLDVGRVARAIEAAGGLGVCAWGESHRLPESAMVCRVSP